ncbi:hypothetical protein Kfla_5724 [Kribbella flavida DSM 17836]|uniref:Uncharacterized protein n=1 Tax=Kribbella flavida (strain DSM 17836 / JCM 10339 / NBRC 14399) TaxID=479435 RepID=D2PPD3_KRIFD|nr:hypothetical protein [Kribbella flavida]ADB34729.1 hypothetical protein Kfla_5724 [Kribbella flavida DSM 17836]
MRAEDLAEALQAEPIGDPLDPATVIAGYRRRRRRNLAVAASTALVLVVLGGGAQLLGGGAPSPLPPAAPPSSVPTVARAPGAAEAERACRAEVAATANRARRPPKPSTTARVVAEQRVNATGGHLLVLADDTSWVGCDTAADGGKAVITSATDNNAAVDAGTFAAAYNVLKVSGTLRSYRWAAGVLPPGVAKVRYTFWDGSRSVSQARDGYWIMQHVSDAPASGNDVTRPIRVDLLDGGGTVTKTYQVDPTDCPLTTRGC